MAWIRIPGVKGKVYQPEHQPQCPRKHHCHDCHICQMCSDTRCDACRAQESRLRPELKKEDKTDDF